MRCLIELSRIERGSNEFEERASFLFRLLPFACFLNDDDDVVLPAHCSLLPASSLPTVFTFTFTFTFKFTPFSILYPLSNLESALLNLQPRIRGKPTQTSRLSPRREKATNDKRRTTQTRRRATANTAPLSAKDAREEETGKMLCRCILSDSKSEHEPTSAPPKPASEVSEVGNQSIPIQSNRSNRSNPIQSNP